MKTNINSIVNPPPPNAKLLKLAIDAHKSFYVVAAMRDNSPKPPQRFVPEAFLTWVQTRIKEGLQVIACYEAGPLGYVLHRKLTALGATNYVVRPRDWDDNRKKRKTDRWDAKSMLNALDRFLAGNPDALCLVRVPTEDQEQRRSLVRLRESFKGEVKRLAQRARGIALNYGFSLRGTWHGPRTWPHIKPTLPEWLQHLLEPLRQSVGALQEQLDKLENEIQALAPAQLPVGIGPLTWVILESEICDWHRFDNRRQVASLTGLTPGEDSSGDRRHLGPISKCGNPRVRQSLCEAAWRLLRFQASYHLVRKWYANTPRTTSAPAWRKRQIAALARGLAVDWWRLRTGQTTPEKLGLKMNSGDKRPKAN